jgi:hypothetical protein
VATFGEPLPREKLWLSVMAAAIALLTSVNAFYRWDESWRGFINAQLELERLRDRWEIEIAGAKTHPNLAERLNLAKAATERFVEQAREAIQSEST